MGLPSNRFIRAVTGRILAIILTAIGFAALAKKSGKLSPRGYFEEVVDGYLVVANFLLGFLDFIPFDWFEVDDFEKSAISLILILGGGVSLWFKNRLVKFFIPLACLVVSAIVFGIFLVDSTVDLVIALFMFIFAFPFLIAFRMQYDVNLSFPNRVGFLGIKFFDIPFIRSLGERYGNHAFDFFGIAALKIEGHQVRIIPNRNALTPHMIAEYLFTIFWAVILIFFLYLAGLIELLA